MAEVVDAALDAHAKPKALFDEASRVKLAHMIVWGSVPDRIQLLARQTIEARIAAVLRRIAVKLKQEGRGKNLKWEE